MDDVTREAATAFARLAWLREAGLDPLRHERLLAAAAEAAYEAVNRAGLTGRPDGELSALVCELYAQDPGEELPEVLTDPPGGVYASSPYELLAVADHMLRWSTRMTVLAHQGGAAVEEERSYRLHRAVVADRVALLSGMPADEADAEFTAVALLALLALDDESVAPPHAAYVSAPREYVRASYRAWLVANPALDPLTPGGWDPLVS
ncbi:MULTISPECIES: hypothetical protein [unclassified Streptomyces]|uniref:hypothetical protein n=1 Tax=unclassified Streptomyces TaxID=2593676 RepID=UPI003324DAB3